MGKNLIFAIIGPSGAGKSALITAAVERCTGLMVIRSLTTRPRRSAEDSAFYRGSGILEMAALIEDGRLVRAVRYAEHFYGTERTEVDFVLSSCHGILATTPAGAVQLEEAGYAIKVVRIIPMFHEEPDCAKRRLADRANMEHPLPADLEIINSFSSGGKEKAADQLVRFVESFVP